MNKMPCIRGLAQFKKGCPQRSWNGEDGCPAWIELDMATKGGQDKIEIRECLDIYMSRLMFYNNALLESNQQAIQSFRNGMVYKDESGAIIPKPNVVDIALLNIITNSKNKETKYVEGEITEE